jgi:hypothetical protein
LKEWKQAKAQLYGISESQVQTILDKERLDLNLRVKAHTEKYAVRIAKARGLGVLKALNTLHEALDANLHFFGRDKDGQLVNETTAPDWKARLYAVEKVIKLNGGYPAQEVQVTHSLSDELMEMEKDKLEQRAAELLLELQANPDVARGMKQLKQQRRQQQALNVEFTEVERPSQGTSGNPGGPTGANSAG